MSQTITLTLPENFFRPAQRTAQATNQPIEEVLLHALQASLPSLEGLPEDLLENLTALEMLDDQSLWQVMGERVPTSQQRTLSDLLDRQRSITLTDVEQQQLTTLQWQADLIMLRKARAAVLLRFRGKRIPTLTELDRLTVPSA